MAHLHCHSFTMNLYGLLFSLSLALADSRDYERFDDIHGPNEFVTCMNEQKMNSSSDAQDNNFLKNYNFSWDNITCMVYKLDQLNCSWSTQTLPKETQYSATLYEHRADRHLSCISDTAKERIECRSFISDKSMTLFLNISIPGHRCTLQRNFDYDDIEKLDPPEMYITLVRSEYIEIRWSLPKEPEDCFVYELQINDENVQLHDVTERFLNKSNIDPTRSYAIKIRTQMSEYCASPIYWSEWSAVMVVGPTESPYRLNALVIACIVFILPMILLTFLLVCKFQRLTEKLLPSVPSPSARVKMLLEKDNFCHVMPPKHVDWVSEGEILQVTS
ncbi:interleukin-5 receptor subunit alpha-like isoform X2 [Brachyhypopomus gauderio]|uniref:interleukin-5 receptor subunit alpha-like isoform X2 n=1 Tax=Brachyhypopomus gauderio TaxID=698409 RepID=UPI0040436953